VNSLYVPKIAPTAGSVNVDVVISVASGTRVPWYVPYPENEKKENLSLNYNDPYATELAGTNYFRSFATSFDKSSPPHFRRSQRQI
jgi:hypothetical protein